MSSDMLMGVEMSTFRQRPLEFQKLPFVWPWRYKPSTRDHGNCSEVSSGPYFPEFSQCEFCYFYCGGLSVKVQALQLWLLFTLIAPRDRISPIQIGFVFSFIVEFFPLFGIPFKAWCMDVEYFQGLHNGCICAGQLVWRHHVCQSNFSEV